MRIGALRFLGKLALGCMLMLPIAASAETHGHFGGGGHVIIAPRYPYYSTYWGWRGPYWGWGGPYWGYWPYPYDYYETVGKIEIKDHNKSDEVLINGAYAGTVDKMKTVKLSPGSYTLQIRREGKDILSQNIYVVAGKKVEVNVDGG